MRSLSNRKAGSFAPRRAAGSSRWDWDRRLVVAVVAVAASSTSTSASASSSSSSASFKLFRPPGATPPRRHPSSATPPLLVHIPGADGTGVSLGRQARLLSEAGFEVWSSAFDFGEEGGGGGDERRSKRKSKGDGRPETEEDPWGPLVAAADAAFSAAFQEGEEDDEGDLRRPVILAESFGASLALRLASRDPRRFKSLVLVNSATALSFSSNSSSSSSGPNRSLSSALVGIAAATGIARFLPVPVYRGAAAVLTPLLLDARGSTDDGDRGSENESENGSESESALLAAAKMMSLGGGTLTRTTTNGVAKRLELLSRADPGEAALQRVTTRTLLVASARDALLPSVSEAGRLSRILPNSSRLLLPDSGHAALLEARLDLAAELERAGFGAGAGAAAAAAVAVVEEEGKEEKGEESSSSSSSLSLSSSSVQPPWSLSDPEFDGAVESLRLLRELVSPLVTGGEFLESLTAATSVSSSSSTFLSSTASSSLTERSKKPSRSKGSPILFVSNHSRFGIYDLVFVLAELYSRGIKARGLAHKNHFDSGSPLGPIFKRFGAVAASPRSAFRLLAEGEAVLLFPGGAAEVNKGKGQDYQLLWKKEADFVRLAARFPGCKIVPFAAVGAEEAYDLILDQKEQLSNPVLGPLARAAFNSLGLEAEEALLPLAALPFTRGLVPAFPIPLPRPERLYFEFCEPIDAAAMIAETSPEETYARVRSEVEAAIERQRRVRASDPLRPTGARLREAAKRFVPRRLEF